MNMPAARTASLQSWAAPRWTWHSVLLAGLVTAAVFTGLRFLERLTHPPEKTLALREVRTAIVAPPPAAAPPPPRPPPEPARRDTARPQLERATPRMNLAPLALSLAPGGRLPGGDFTADFAIALPAFEAPAVDAVFEIADLDQPPRALLTPQPLYPPQARARRIEGEVVLEFVVAADGSPGRVEVVSGQPAGLFDTAAVNAVKRWRFQPGVKGGGPVAVRVRQKLSFRLE